MAQKYYPLGNTPRYFQLALLSATTVMALSCFKRKIETGENTAITPGDARPVEDIALSQLEGMQECFDNNTDLGRCFFDYSNLRKNPDYDTLSREWAKVIEQAKKEITERKPSSGIEKLMLMAHNLGDFCLEQTDSGYVRLNEEALV